MSNSEVSFSKLNFVKNTFFGRYDVSMNGEAIGSITVSIGEYHPDMILIKPSPEVDVLIKVGLVTLDNDFIRYTYKSKLKDSLSTYSLELTGEETAVQRFKVNGAIIGEATVTEDNVEFDTNLRILVTLGLVKIDRQELLNLYKTVCQITK